MQARRSKAGEEAQMKAWRQRLIMVMALAWVLAFWAVIVLAIRGCGS